MNVIHGILLLVHLQACWQNMAANQTNKTVENKIKLIWNLVCIWLSTSTENTQCFSFPDLFYARLIRIVFDTTKICLSTLGSIQFVSIKIATLPCNLYGVHSSHYGYQSTLVVRPKKHYACLFDEIFQNCN